MDTITVAQVRALNQVIDATEHLMKWVSGGHHTQSPVVVAALARLDQALDVCSHYDLWDEATILADESGLTSDLIDRLTDDDVQAAAEHLANA